MLDECSLLMGRKNANLLSKIIDNVAVLDVSPFLFLALGERGLNTYK